MYRYGAICGVYHHTWTPHSTTHFVFMYPAGWWVSHSFSKNLGYTSCSKVKLGYEGHGFGVGRNYKATGAGVLWETIWLG